MKFLLISLVVLSASFGVIHGLKCYKCSYNEALSSVNPWCSEVFDDTDTAAPQATVTCGGVCTKIKQEYGDITLVIRDCQESITVSACPNTCTTSTVLGNTVESCQNCCDTDLCNSASSVTSNLLAAVAMLVCALAWSY